MKRLIITLLISGIAATSSATIINIPADYPTIQQGISASADGDTVLVQPGTYVENINFNGHNIVLGSLFLTTGNESYIASTVIDGDSSGAVFTLSNFENSSTVITGFKIVRGGGVQGGGIICDGAGPLITRNYIIENYGESGGGIYCIQAYPVISENVFTANASSGIGCYSSWPKITNNTFMGNFAEMGGAIYCENSPDAVISGNYISRNYDIGDGAGIYCNMSDAAITGNLITENIAGRGGGIFCQQSSPGIRGNTISMNQAETNGGGIYLFQSDPVMANNIIANNLSNSYGAGLFCNHSNPYFINNTVTGNSANTGGGGVYNFYSVPAITNSIFWTNSAPAGPEIFNYSNSSEITYSDIQGGWAGEGNIDIDPLFKYAAGGDYHLMVSNCGDTLNSPCIDAGDPAILDSLLDCSWGLGGPRSDMGAYGGGDSVTVGIWGDNSPLPERFMLFQNYPNPFNSETSIKFSIVNSSDVQLAVYDILGREVGILIDKHTGAGSHTVMFDAKGLSSGIYFYRLRAGDVVETKRMVLLK